MTPDEAFKLRTQCIEWGEAVFDDLAPARQIEVLRNCTPILVRADTKKAALAASGGMLGEPIAIDDWMVDIPEEVGVVGGIFFFEEPLRIPLDESWVREETTPRGAFALVSALSWVATLLTGDERIAGIIKGIEASRRVPA